MIRQAAHILALCLPALPVGALDLEVPAAARVTLTDASGFDRYVLPLSPWSDGRMETVEAEGALARSVWQIASYSGTTAQLISPLQAQLEAAGYEVLFSCSDRDCGGFDFRFALDVTPEPAMHVDLGDFTYLTARKSDDAGIDYVALLASQGGGRGYLHMVRVAPPGSLPAEVTPSSRRPAAEAPLGDLAQQLETRGMATLDDLSFATGSSSLDGGQYASLGALADFLAADPARRVALVGHTDAEGGLDSNIALSRARARAVRDYLVSSLNVSADQLQAEGVGYLAPRAPNLSVEGREANRRVEVILLNTE